MYEPPASHPVSALPTATGEWLVIARPMENGEAAELADLLREGGCEVQVDDRHLPNRIVDVELTMGDIYSLKPLNVAVRAIQLPLAARLLDAVLTVDESDPLHAATPEELDKIRNAPLDGNLIDKLLVAKITGKPCGLL